MKGRQEAAVGAAILGALALVVFGTLWLKGHHFGADETELRARFREIGLLAPGNPVKMRGVPVGKVESVELEQDGEAVLVIMTVKGGLRFPKDPVVLVAPKSMFGDWQAEVFPRSAFPLYDYLESPDRRILPGFTLPDMSRLTVVADQIARNLAVLTDRFGIAFTEETAVNIREAIDNIEQVSAKLTTLVDAQQKTVSEVGGNLQQTSAALMEASSVAQRAFAQIDTSVGHGELKDMMGNMKRSAARLDSISAAMVSSTRQLKATLGAADTAFRAVSAVAGSVQRGEGTLGQLVRDTALYMQLVGTNAELQALIKDIKLNPKKYINVRVF
jgi:phospholipid/cholesterol/gamma-HCH transport system substrate-binding protein